MQWSLCSSEVPGMHTLRLVEEELKQTMTMCLTMPGLSKLVFFISFHHLQPVYMQKKRYMAKNVYEIQFFKTVVPFGTTWLFWCFDFPWASSAHS